MKRLEKAQQGFTLMELLIVVVIIALLAALLVPVLGKAQKQAQARNCMAKAKALATSLRTYASSWQGYTPPDAETALTKEFGFKKYTEKGYYDETPGSWYSFSGEQPSKSQIYASKVTSFRCPSDEDPRRNKNGLPMSYFVGSQYSGGNVTNMTSSDTRTVVIVERGKRHLDDDNKMTGHYVYADLHAALGPPFKSDENLPLSPGMRMRAWNVNSFGGLQGVAEARLPTRLEGNPPFRYEGIWSGDLRASSIWWLAYLDGYSYSNDWNMEYQQEQSGFRSGTGYSLIAFPQTVTIRMDGVIRFPHPGTYEFYMDCPAVSEGGAGMAFSVGAPDDILDPTNFTYFSGANDPTNNYSVLVSDSDQRKIHPIQFYYRAGSLSSGWKILWTHFESNGKVNPTIRNVPVASQYIMHVPQ